MQVMINWRATIILFQNGDVVGFGSNDLLSLGQCTDVVQSELYYIGDVESEMGNNLPLIFGSDIKVKGLASSTFVHFCVVTVKNELRCWGGSNSMGELGLGHRYDRP
jgi:alpha-tubulin suppressor-like RCC1 family protein